MNTNETPTTETVQPKHYKYIKSPLNLIAYLDGNSYKLFIYIINLANLSKNDNVTNANAYYADAINLDEKTIRKCLIDLTDKNFLVKKTFEIGKMNTYFLNRDLIDKFDNYTFEEIKNIISTEKKNNKKPIEPTTEQLPIEVLPTALNNTIEILNKEMKEFEEEQEEQQPEEIENNNIEKPIERFNNFLNSQKIIDIAMYAVNDNFSLNEIQSILKDRYSIKSQMKRDVVESNLLSIMVAKQMNTEYKFNNI